MANRYLRFSLLVTLLFLALHAFTQSMAWAHRQALLPSTQTLNAQVTQLTLATRDLLYDPVSDKLYASVPSSAGANGNSIVAITVPTGTIGAPIFVGSEPNKLARSADGRYLYVGLDGAGAIRRVNLISQTAELQFALGSDFCGLNLAEDMVVLQDNANAVAVARRNAGCSPRHQGVAIYDDGVQRSTTTPGHTGSNAIEGGAAATQLYGYNNETTEYGFRTMNVSAAGVTVASTKQGLLYGFNIDLHFADGLLYATNGVALDPATQTLIGRYATSGLVYADPVAERVYFLNTSGQLQLSVFDQKRFTLIETLPLTGVTGTPSRLLKIGENLFAFRTSADKVVFVRLSDQPATPTPTPTPTATPVFIAGSPFGVAIRTISLTTQDLVYDPGRNQIYASLPSSAGRQGNSIAAIIMPTGTVGLPVFVGSEPNKLALADNGQYLYVGLDGAGAVRRFNVISQTAELQFSLGGSSCGAYAAEDMAVLQDNANAVAVVRRTTAGCSPRHAGVAIFDDGVQRATTTPGHTGSNVIERSNTSALLYGYNNETSEFGLRTLTVDATGISVTNVKQGLLSGYNTDMRFSGGLLYATNGALVDPTAQTVVGTYGAAGLVYPDPAAGRVYFISTFGQPELKIFDQSKFTPISTISLSGVTGTPSSLIQTGENRLAFRTSAGKLYLLHLIESTATPTATSPATPTPTATTAAAGSTATATATPGSSATATATPTPTALPPAVPGEIVGMTAAEFTLTTKDLIYDPQHNVVFASLPSSAGSSGNSLVAITVPTGTVGSPIFMGSEPNKLALSDDSRYLYVGLDGAGAIRRFNIISQTVESPFVLGSDSCGVFQAGDMVVLPGKPNTVAVARRSALACSPRHRRVVIYTDGVQRPTTTNHIVLSNAIEPADNDSLLYGYNNESTEFGFYTFALNEQGITLSTTTPGLITGFGHDMRAAGGLIYATTGAVINPTSKTLVGSYNASGLVYPDPASGRVYFLVMAGQPELRIFHLSNFTPLKSFPIPDVAGTPSSLIKLGANRLAFRTDAQEMFFLTLLEATPTATVTPTATPTTPPGAVPTMTATATSTALPVDSVTPTPTLIPDPDDTNSHLVHLPLIQR